MTHTIAFLAFSGMKLLDVAGPAEVFSEANRLGADYELTYLSPDGEPVSTSIGTSLAVSSAARSIRHVNTVVIPGSDALPTTPIPWELGEAARVLVDAGERVASVCTGVFLLASIGALEGRRVTTHWQHTGLLAKAYPNTTVIPDAIFVSDGKFFSSAGVSAGIDLALALVESDHGSRVAQHVARNLVMFMQRPGGQSQFSSMLEISPSTHDGVRRAVDTLLADPAGEHTVDSLATDAGVSPRHLVRLFQTDFGITPTKLIEQVRLETAKTLLLRGETVTLAARRSGFHSTETMRRSFVTHLGTAPNAFKKRFRTTDRTGTDSVSA